ncbi:MAG: long-chain fatty acid--CoA ligase [Verrucomicrobiota bacterium]
MNLAGAFAASVQLHPEKNALFWGERVWTYSELWSQTLFMTGILHRQHAVQPADRVGLWMKNRPEFIPAMLGILQAGAAVVPINSFLKPDEVRFILDDAGIDALIVDRELAPFLPELQTGRPGLKGIIIEDTLATFPVPPGHVKFDTEILRNPAREASDLAMLVYTSGTTGRPKGAMLSHANLLHNVESCRIVLRTVEDDRIAVILPMFHSYMITVGMLLPLIVGGSIVLVKSLHPVRNALQEIFGRRATILPAIPQFYRSLVLAEIPAPLPLRLCISGSAPLPVEVLRQFESKFGIPLIEGYGLSEASPVVAKNPLDRTRKPGSIGLPIPNVEMSIQDENGNLLNDRKIGEICVRGGNVMIGYWNQMAETAKVFRNGWLLTGDIGFRDEEGFYYITDRKKDMLLVNGNNVYPREIEEVLYQFPGVLEAAVIGRQDPRRGEQPVAYVIPAPNIQLDPAALARFVRSKLADYKVPRQILIVAELPRNSMGKVLKTSLRTLDSRQSTPPEPDED